MLDDLAALLQLVPTGDDAFENVPRASGHLYGGWSQGLALRAATATVAPGLLAHSSHAVFPSAGDAGPPLRLRVQRVRDGRSSAIRQVTADQDGEIRLLLTATFAADAPGSEWQEPSAPPPRGPEEIATDRSALVGMDPVEFRPLGSARYDGGAPVMTPPHPFWARPRVRPPDDPGLAASVLAFVSDYMIVAASQVPGTLPAAGSQVASLEHTLWIHRPVQPADWLRYDAAPFSVASGRGFVRGTVRDRDGDLVASFAQEALTRPPRS